MTDPEAPVAVITGGGRGMGRAIAETLAAIGWRVVVGARSAAELDAVVAGIRAAGGDARAVVADVTRATDVHALVEAALAAFGRLDAIVVNAGIAANSPIAAARVVDWNRMIDVNLRGVLHAFAAAVPVLQRQGSGHVVVIGSTAAAKWVPGQGVYAATKAGVRAVTEVLRQELAPEGIRVTLVNPGFTDTGFVDATPDDAERAALQARRDQIAMPASAVAEAVRYALSQPAGVDVGEITVRPTVQS